MKKTNLTIKFYLRILIIQLTAISISAQVSEIEKLLELDLESLTNISIISATKTVSTINEVPSTVRVITEKTIKENGYLTLEDALSCLPGFQFRNILGFNSYIFQRGIPNQNNLILLLIDGIQVNELNSGGFYAGGQFNLDNVKQIEVIYGPSSSLYGTNAISGIINIITKSTKESKGFSISGLYGSFKTYNVSTAYSYYDESSDFGLRISAMIKSSEKADLKGEDGDYNWTNELENFEDDYSFEIKSDYKNLQLGILYQNKQSSRSTNYKSFGTEFWDKNSLWNISFFNGYLKYQHDFSHMVSLNSTAYYRSTTLHDNSVAFVTDSFQVGYYRPASLAGIENMITYQPFEDLKIIGGVQFEYEKVSEDFSTTYSSSPNEKPPVPNSPKTDKNTLLSSYLQGQYHFIECLELYIGARFDHSSFYENVFTPRLGFVFNKDKFTVKLLYSEAFRAPEPWDYSFGIGNSNLKPEEIRSYEAAVNFRATENIILGAALYHNKYYNLLTIITEGTGQKFINRGKSNTLGSELTFDYKSRYVNVFANYTYNLSEDENGNELPEISKHVANAGITYFPVEVIGISLRGTFLGKRRNNFVIPATGNDLIDEALILNSSISYTGIEHIRLSLLLNNILDQKYFHTSNRPPERYRQPQRTLMFKIEFNI